MKKMTALLLALLMMFSLCACGSSTSSSYAKAAGDSAVSYNSSYEAAYAEPAAYDMDDYGGFSAVAAEEGRGAENDAPEVDPEKIIYSSDVTVETTSFDETVARVEGMAKEYGGWIESSSVNGANFYDVSRGYSRNRNASFSLRIPSSRFNEVMGTLSELGNIPYSHTYTENVTAQYYDVQARLTAYEAQETRLLEMMELAETVEDVILLESRLSELRYQIESLQSTLKNWDRRVSYSSVYLTVKEVQEYTPEPEVRVSYGEELIGALKDGLVGVGEFLKGLLLFLVEILPALVILVPLGWLLVKLIKKIHRWRKARTAARKAKKAAAAAAKTAAKAEAQAVPAPEKTEEK